MTSYSNVTETMHLSCTCTIFEL